MKKKLMALFIAAGLLLGGLPSMEPLGAVTEPNAPAMMTKFWGNTQIAGSGGSGFGYFYLYLNIPEITYSNGINNEYSVVVTSPDKELTYNPIVNVMPQNSFDKYHEEETNLYHYNFNGSYSGYNAWVSSLSVSTEDDIAGTYTLSLYNREDVNYSDDVIAVREGASPILSDTIVLDTFTVHGEDGATIVHSWSKDDSNDSYSSMNLDPLKQEGKVISGLNDSSRRYHSLGDYNDTALFRDIVSASSVGTDHDLTAVYIDNAAVYPETPGWSTSTTGAVSYTPSDNTYYMIWFEKQGEGGTWTPKNGIGYGWTNPSSAGVDNLFRTYDAENNICSDMFFVSNVAFSTGTYRFTIGAATNSSLIRTAVLSDPSETLTLDYSTTLDAPANPRWDSDVQGLAHWDAVEGAIGYNVVIQSRNTKFYTSYTVPGTSLNVSNSITNAGRGNYVFQVRAISGDLSQKGSSLYSDESPVMGLSANSITAISDVSTASAATDNMNIDSLTDDNKNAINEAVDTLKSSYETASAKTDLRNAIQADPDTQEMIKGLAEFYAAANDITYRAPDVAEDVRIDSTNIKVIGAELNVSTGSSVQLKLTNPTTQPNYSSVYSSVLAFNMSLVDGEGNPIEKETNLDVPTTIKLPVPDDMDPITLRILHYINGNSNPEVIYPAFETINGQLMAVFTVNRFSLFAFAEETSNSGGNTSQNQGTVAYGGGGSSSASSSSDSDSKTTDSTSEGLSGPISANAVKASRASDGTFKAPNGDMITNAVVEAEDGNKYVVGGNGKTVKNEIVKATNGKQMITDKDGKVLINTIVKHAGVKYAISKNGFIKKSMFSKTKLGNMVYSGKNGQIVVDRVFSKDGNKYVSGKSGAIIKSNTVVRNGKKYFCDENGVVYKVKKVK